MLAYHDEEWGVPSHDERHLFELLTLEGAQAGLSWSTILNKRDGYRRAFAGFDVRTVAAFGPRRRRAAARRPRHRPQPAQGRVDGRERARRSSRSTASTRTSGRSSAASRSSAGGRSLADLPAETDLSRALSRDLKKHGFRFVGPTVCYSFMQAVGLANDHTTSCFRYAELTQQA